MDGRAYEAASVVVSNARFYGGRYLLVSIVDATISFYDPDFHRRETTLLSSRNATREPG